MKKIILAVCLIISTVMASTIGYIDMERVFKSYKETKKIEKEFLKKEKDYNKLLAEKQQELREARIEGKSEKEIEKLTKTLEKELLPKKEELEKLFQQNIMEIRQDINKSSEIVARDLNLDVVIEKQAIIYGGVDISDLVIEKLNK